MERQELEFEMYKEGKLLGMQVSEWTDEMKWWAIANDKSLAFDPATLSNDMVIRGLKERHENVFIPEVINSHDIPENVYVEYINNAPDGAKWMNIFGVEQMSDCEALQTHDIMLALCLRQPLYMELLDDTDVEFTDDDYFKIADVYFTDEKKRKHIEWNDQPMADRHWQIVAKEHIDIDNLISRDDCPRYVFEEWLSTATRYDIAKLPSISGKLTEAEARNLFELIHKRRKKSSTIFCSQFRESEWYQQTCDGESTLADAIMDRISYDSYKIDIESVDPSKDLSMREVYGLDPAMAK